MAKIRKSEFKGELEIGDMLLSCAVLDDGTRLITENSIVRNLGSVGGKNYKLRNKRTENEDVGPIPLFLSSKALTPFIYEVFTDKDLLPIMYTTDGKNIQKGYDANILPKVCEVWLKARENNKLQTSQLPKAKKAEIIMRSLAKIAVTALIDEATGYQYVRESNALQVILKAYINEELLKWQKMFPDAFYFEIFRLNKWNYTVNGINKRPGVIGSWTKELIYNQLPKGVLEELKEKTPKSKSGNYTARFFQSLTQDIGHPALTAQIYKVIGIMNISENWSDFKNKFNKMVDRNNGQTELNFEYIEKKIEKENIKKTTELSSFNKKLKKGLNFNPKKNNNNNDQISLNL